MPSRADWSKTTHVSFDSQGTRLLGEPHLTTQGTKGKSRSDWSGTQSQLWSNPQFPPQKTKFDGNWYFEDELIFSYPADKYNNNIFMDGYTGGKILMTIYEAQAIGLTPDQVLNYYKQDELFKKRADSVNRKPAFFFEYRKDGSIIGIFKPPIVPPPAPVQIPPALVELQQQLSEAQLTPQMIKTALSAPPPAPVVEPVPVGNLNPYQLKTTIDPKWILLAVVGVGILSAMIFIMRGKK